MEGYENPKPWFISRDGMRSSPFAMEELKAKGGLQQLHPRSDLARKEGRGDSRLVGQVNGWVEKKSKTEDDALHANKGSEILKVVIKKNRAQYEGLISKAKEKGSSVTPFTL